MRRGQISKLVELSRALKRIEKKIDFLIDGTETKRRSKKREEAMGTGEGLDIMTLLTFPDHLRKSAMTIMKLGKAMAEDVAKETVGADAVAPREVGLSPDLDLDHVSRTDPVAGDPLLPESGSGQDHDRGTEGPDDREQPESPSSGS